MSFWCMSAVSHNQGTQPRTEHLHRIGLLDWTLEDSTIEFWPLGESGEGCASGGTEQRWGENRLVIWGSGRWGTWEVLVWGYRVEDLMPQKGAFRLFFFFLFKLMRLWAYQSTRLIWKPYRLPKIPQNKGKIPQRICNTREQGHLPWEQAAWFALWA